jgi:hypothetical protein
MKCADLSLHYREILVLISATMYTSLRGRRNERRRKRRRETKRKKRMKKEEKIMKKKKNIM